MPGTYQLTETAKDKERDLTEGEAVLQNASMNATNLNDTVQQIMSNLTKEQMVCMLVLIEERLIQQLIFLSYS